MSIVKDIMTKNVQYTDPDTTVTHLAGMMKDIDCGFIPIAEKEKLIGVVTDRDIVLRCTARDRDPVMTMAKDIMTPEVLYCYDHNSIDEVALNMAQNKIRRLPVLDHNKKLVGVVSIGDVSCASENRSMCGYAMDRISA